MNGIIFIDEPNPSRLRTGNLWNTKVLVVLLIFLMMGMLSFTYSLPTSTQVISTAGKISPDYSVNATGGSPTNIQNAVNNVYAHGGGTVYIPAGNFTFDISATHIGAANEPCGVQIPGGVNIIGAGNNTILYCPITGWDSGAYNPYSYIMFLLDGANNKSIRISGIYFEGSINYTLGTSGGNPTGGENTNLVAIEELGVPNYRIDHCTFINFDNAAIYVTNNYVQNPYGNCGVIDHCKIDNPYKNVYINYTGQYPIWGYGIIFSGDDQASKNWRSLSSVLGQYGPDTAIIENNYFRRCRHCVAGEGSGSGGWAIVRYNYCTDNVNEAMGSFIDCHGGGRGYEVYDNTLVDVPYDYRSGPQSGGDWGNHYNRGIYPRGGSGVIFNNTIINCYTGIGLANDQNSNATWRLHDFWVWGNTFTNVADNFTTSPGAYSITQNVDYFLRAPNQAQDGFTYTPYTYPCPLTLQP